MSALYRCQECGQEHAFAVTGRCLFCDGPLEDAAGATTEVARIARLQTRTEVARTIDAEREPFPRGRGHDLVSLTGSGGPLDFACPQCDARFGSTSMLGEHRRRDHGRPTSPVTSAGNNIAAVLSTWAGVVSLLALPLKLAWLWFFCAVAALVLGFVGRTQIERDGTEGRGYAIAGLVMGFVPFGIVLLYILIVVAFIGMLLRLS